MNGFATTISDAGNAVGRYFSVVSFIPSLFLTGFTFALIESGAFNRNGKLDWPRAATSLTHAGDLVLLALVSMVIGIAVHPAQLALVQFFEGYWGTGKLAQRARVARILHYRKKFDELAYGPGAKARLELLRRAGAETILNPADHAKLQSIWEESSRLFGAYPQKDEDLMPTRLGNVLRRYERLAGSQYGLDAVIVTGHLALLAPATRAGYLNDRRQLLDLSVRMCVTSLIATLVAIAALWPHRLWLLLALIPYCIAYFSYRGAVVVAHAYGSAFSMLIDLDRFALYEQLRMPLPKDTAAERTMNSRLIPLLQYDSLPVLPYEHPSVSAARDDE